MTPYQSLLMDARIALSRAGQHAPTARERAAVDACIRQIDKLLIVSTAGPPALYVQDRTGATEAPSSP